MLVQLFVFIFVFIFITAIFIIGWHFSSMVIHPKVQTYNYTYDFEVEKGTLNVEEFNRLEKQEVYIDSQYGYKIHGFFFPNKDSKKIIILSHGVTLCLYGSVEYMDMFLKRGFAVLIYDHRNHGLSGGSDTSFGFYEKFDLKKCTDWLYNKLGDDIIVGLHGESMGAGVVLQNISIDDRIKFCIDDCGYSDAQDLFKHRLERDHGIKKLPLIKLASKITKMRVGWEFSDVSPIATLPKVEIPILFIHGAEDDYVPTYMCKQMYSVKNGYKDIYIAANAGHTESYWTNKGAYEEKVDSFLKNNNII